MQKVSLPDGQYAVLRDKVNVGGRQALERTVAPALAAIVRVRKLREDVGIEDVDLIEDEGPKPTARIPYTEAEMEAIQRFQKAGIVALVKHFSDDRDVPTSIDDVDDMEPEDYDALAKATATLAWSALRRKKTSPDDGFVEGENGQPVAVLDSPTTPLSGSGSAERALSQQPEAPGSTSTTTSPESLVSATSGSSSPA